MSVKTYVELYFDVNANALRDNAGNLLRVSQYPRIAYKQRLVINLNLVTDSALTAYTELDGTATYQVSLDNEFSSSSLMCKTLTAGFNVDGDWDSSSEQAVPALGELSFGLNGSTTGFLSKISDDAEVPGTQLELQVYNDSGNMIEVWRFPFRALGILNDSGAVPDEESNNFQWFTTASGASGLRIVNQDGEVLETLTPVGE